MEMALQIFASTLATKFIDELQFMVNKQVIKMYFKYLDKTDVLKRSDDD